MTLTVNPVDEVLPAPKLVALGLQHVLVMYARRGRAAHHRPRLEAAARGRGVPHQRRSVRLRPRTPGAVPRLPGVGIRLPVMMGVTFASVGPMLSMAAAPDIGILGIFGSVIAAGIFSILVAPFISRMLPLFRRW